LCGAAGLRVVLFAVSLKGNFSGLAPIFVFIFTILEWWLTDNSVNRGLGDKVRPVVALCYLALSLPFNVNDARGGSEQYDNSVLTPRARGSAERFIWFLLKQMHICFKTFKEI